MLRNNLKKTLLLKRFKYTSSSGNTAPQSLNHQHSEKKFNESPSFEEIKANQKLTNEEEIIKKNLGDFKSLKEKGEIVPEEQERADDFM